MPQSRIRPPKEGLLLQMVSHFIALYDLKKYCTSEADGEEVKVHPPDLSYFWLSRRQQHHRRPDDSVQRWKAPEESLLCQYLKFVTKKAIAFNTFWQYLNLTRNFALSWPETRGRSAVALTRSVRICFPLFRCSFCAPSSTKTACTEQEWKRHLWAEAGILQVEPKSSQLHCMQLYSWVTALRLDGALHLTLSRDWKWHGYTSSQTSVDWLVITNPVDCCSAVAAVPPPLHWWVPRLLVMQLQPQPLQLQPQLLLRSLWTPEWRKDVASTELCIFPTNFHSDQYRLMMWSTVLLPNNIQ